MSEETENSLLTKIYAVCALLGGLLGSFVNVVVVLAGVDAERVDMAVQGGAGIVTCGLIVLATVQTLRRHGTAQALWTFAAIAGVVFVLVAIGGGDGDFAVVAVMASSPGFVGALLAWTRVLTLAPSTVSRPRGPFAAILLLVTVAFSALLVFRNDIVELRDEIRRTRWDGVCQESGEAHSCGYWALYTFRYSADYDELRRARTTLDRVCREGSSRACGLLALSVAGSDELVSPDAAEKRKRVAGEQCAAGESGACAAVALMEEDGRDFHPVAASGCERGDPTACWVAAFTAQGDEEFAKFDAKLCEFGFARFCESHTPTCETDLSKCDYEYVVPEGEHWNEAMYGVTAKGDDLSAACDGGNGEACFALGLNLTAELNPIAEQLPLKTMDLTFGRACKLGFDRACEVFALRVLDRPVLEKPDTKLALELLGSACDRGDPAACWTRHLVAGTSDVGVLTEAAEKACRTRGRSSECLGLVYTRAAELGIDPFPFLDPPAQTAAFSGCVGGDEPSCLLAAQIQDADYQPWGTALPLHVRTIMTLAKGCELGDVAACKRMFMASPNRRATGIGTVENLKAQICPQLPAACEP